jgi:NADH:ubiquinone oxidoreductase subunit F (NADH-binding)
MGSVSRVLEQQPVTTLDDHVAQGGGSGLRAAEKLGPAAVIEEIEASGLRGRGGAGFPTGRKWRTVAENRSPSFPTTVVVNGAEGEPGSFKDRAILRANPYRVLEGALIAATAMEATQITIAVKASFEHERRLLEAARAELQREGWLDGTVVAVLAGPSEYLYGEETALLEVIDGRAPFPRIAPPYRHGVDELASGAGSAAPVPMAAPDTGTPAPPTLVNNVETLAHVACILAEGPEWFRREGTAESPGTIVCTVSGDTRRHGVAEFAMGAPLRTVVDSIGGGVRRGREVAAVLTGVSHPLLPAARLDTPLSYEGMEAAGSGLGTAGFIVFDDDTDFAAVAHAVSRFLAIESCGQCTPCKQDGLALAELFDRVRTSQGADHDLRAIDDHIRTVADEARCFLAHQHQQVASSITAMFPDDLRAHTRVDGRSPANEVLIAPIVDFDGDTAVLDDGHRNKQPDWTFDATDSGRSPADRIDQRSDVG